MAPLSERDGVVKPASFNGTVKASVCFGVGVRNQGGHQ
jgi:hypothetical protein